MSYKFIQSHTAITTTNGNSNTHGRTDTHTPGQTEMYKCTNSRVHLRRIVSDLRVPGRATTPSFTNIKTSAQKFMRSVCLCIISLYLYLQWWQQQQRYDARILYALYARQHTLDWDANRWISGGIGSIRWWNRAVSLCVGPFEIEAAAKCQQIRI